MSNVYREAAEYLRRNGWTQYQMYKGFRGTDTFSGEACISGAVYAACAGVSRVLSMSDVMPVKAWPEALSFLSGMVGADDRDSGIVGWNDKAGRTSEEVIALLEQAAEKTEADRQ